MEYRFRNELYLSDCRDILKDIPNDFVTTIHTSPPYNIGRGYTGYDDQLEHDDYFSFLTEVIISLYRVLKPGGSVFWQTGYTAEQDGYIIPLDILTYRLFEGAGFKCKDRIIWRYFGGRSFKNKFTNKHETIYWWVKPGADTFFNVFEIREEAKSDDPRNNLFGRNPGNVWEVDRVAFGSHGKTSHLAVFPEEISDRIILSTTNVGDYCLDPFMGSGTFCVVAKSRGRYFFGVDLSPEYFSEASNRLSKIQGNEFDNVLSALILYVLKKDFGGKASVSSITDLLETGFSGSPIKGLSKILGEKFVNVLTLGSENSVTKEEKKQLWRLTRDYLKEAPESEPTVLVDRAYLGRYKLHKVFNGPMRFYKAINWLTQFEYKNNHEGLIGNESIKKLLEKEPGTYGISGDIVTALVPEANYEKVVASPDQTNNSLFLD